MISTLQEYFHTKTQNILKYKRNVKEDYYTGIF